MVVTVVSTGAYITTSTCTKFRRRIAILGVLLSCLLSDLSLLQVLSDESKDVFYSVCRYQLDGKFAPPPSASAVNYAHLTATLGSEGKVGTPSPSPAVTPFRRTASLTGGDRGMPARDNALVACSIACELPAIVITACAVVAHGVFPLPMCTRVVD
jgi:hypothetical protein